MQCTFTKIYVYYVFRVEFEFTLKVYFKSMIDDKQIRKINFFAEFR